MGSKLIVSPIVKDIIRFGLDLSVYDDDGRIYIKDRYILNNGTLVLKKGHFLSSVPNGKYGYRQVGLWNQGKSKRYYVHRLVWEAFNGEIPEGYEVDHNNSLTWDNRLLNLQLLTRKGNMTKSLKRMKRDSLGRLVQLN